MKMIKILCNQSTQGSEPQNRLIPRKARPRGVGGGGGAPYHKAAGKGVKRPGDDLGSSTSKKWFQGMLFEQYAQRNEQITMQILQYSFF